jgi:CheY-like chemotaxis protein
VIDAGVVLVDKGKPVARRGRKATGPTRLAGLPTREYGVAAVLVVDDDPAVREFVGDLLDLEGHEVRFAASGPEALASVREQRPDCLLLDVMMPGMSGHEVLAELRLADGGADLPVVILTALADDAQTWQGWSAGADYVLGKPFDSEQLLRVLAYLADAEHG